MNNVVFVMANSRLAKKQQSRKPAEYNLDDLDSDEEWIVENDDELEGLEDLEIPDDLDLLPQEGGGRVGGHSDDLEIPPLDDDDFDELLQRDGNEDGGNPIEDDEYDDHGLNDTLDVILVLVVGLLSC